MSECLTCEYHAMKWRTYTWYAKRLNVYCETGILHCSDIMFTLLVQCLNVIFIIICGDTT